jgi:hypothetical protein
MAVKRASDSADAPIIAALGSPATVLPDVPVTAVFLVLYVLCFAGNIALHFRNQKSGHRFVWSLALAGRSRLSCNEACRADD